MSYVYLLAVCLASYLYGSIPFGLALGKARGVDVRQHGSGRTGAANTLRTLGLGASAVAFAGDFSKGVVAVVLARVFIGSPAAEAIAAMFAVAGHNWSAFIGFRGGRGVAASVGAVALMFPPAVGVGVVVFAGVLAASRYVSLASIIASASVPVALAPMVLMGIAPAEYLAFSIVAAVLIILQHKDNLERLRAGAERRLGEKAERKAGP